MKILAVSDQIVERLFSLASQGHFRDVSLILGCGDLPYSYLEYLVSVLNVPLYYVPGNHDPEFDPRHTASRAEGGINLDLRLAHDLELVLAGFGGSVRYKPDGPNQYTQAEATSRALRFLPSLLWGRLRRRDADILIAHSPPFGIHDSDGAHEGLKALNLLIRWARPRYLLHGHTHFYRQNLEASETQFMDTRVVNVFPYKVIEISTGDKRR
ncbi:MAG: metallophosphoesterase [Chloroflexota bacterium]